MLESDNLTYNFHKRQSGSVSTKQSDRALITLDRSQKLDLLVHLLTNLQQSLVICGPEGIGKTTLLNILQNSHKQIWPICVLQGSSALSFESVISQLSQFLNLSNTRSGFDIPSLRAFCEKQKVVLIIDDADELVAGLISELMDFADSIKGLRLVFSMDYDEFQSKSSADAAVDTCHFIELPPLNQHQCLQYLQNLSAQPGAPLSFNAITDDLTETLYRQTQGIPGKLLAELPKLGQYQSRQNRRLGFWISIVFILIVGSMAIKIWQPSFTFEDLVASESAEPIPASIEPSIDTSIKPVVELAPSGDATIASPAATLIPEPLIASSLPDAPQMPHAPTEQLADTAHILQTPPPEALQAKPTAVATEPKPKLTVIEEASPIAPPVAKNGELEAKPGEQPAPVVEQKPPKAQLTNSQTGNSDLDWIMAQTANHFTLQVMVLSSKASVDRFLKKYAGYREQLKYYPIGNENQEKYVLIFGSFPSSSEALQQRSNLPSDFDQSLVKLFKQVQKESRRKI